LALAGLPARPRTREPLAASQARLSPPGKEALRVWSATISRSQSPRRPRRRPHTRNACLERRPSQPPTSCSFRAARGGAPRLCRPVALTRPAPTRFPWLCHEGEQNENVAQSEAEVELLWAAIASLARNCPGFAPFARRQGRRRLWRTYSASRKGYGCIATPARTARLRRLHRSSSVGVQRPRPTCAWRPRCTACGGKGATLMHPSWAGNLIGWQPFPADLLARV
jgi:hypothetical protein